MIPNPYAVTCVSALLLNPHQQVLFQHRDNNPAIHFPNYWALWGGHVEDEETPAQAIARELYEEIAYMGHLTWWKTYDFWRSPEVLVHQHLYTGIIDTRLEQIVFHEGQAIRFFGLADLSRYPIAFGFADVCRTFLLQHPSNLYSKTP